MAVLTEKYQYCLLYLLLTDESFFLYYRPILIRFYKQLFSNRYLHNLFLIIVKKLKSSRSIDALSAYIDQAEREGRIDLDEAELYRSYLQAIVQAKDFIPDFQRSFLNFVIERITVDYKNKLNSDFDAYKILATLRSFQIDVLNCLEVFKKDEEDVDKLVDEIVGLHGDLYIPFNLPLDSCPGVRCHELAVVGAATGIGKSWFLLHALWQSLLANRRVMFVSLEMSKSQLFDRLLILHSGRYPKSDYRLVYTDDLVTIKTHQLDELINIRDEVVSMLSFFKEHKCHFVFSGIASASKTHFTFDNILAEISRYESKYQCLPEVIIIDGLEFMRYTTIPNKERWYEEAQCVVALKELARDSSFAIMVNSHVIKNIRNRWVYSQDLSGGAEKARVADIVITLAATSTELSYSIRRLLIAKNRMNPSGHKYWFPVLPERDSIISSVYQMPDPSLKNLDSELAKLSSDYDSEVDFSKLEGVSDEIPF